MRNHRRFALAALEWSLASLASVAAMTACQSDDAVSPLPGDSGTDQSVRPTDRRPTAPFRPATPTKPATRRRAIPTRLLLSYNGGTQSELVAFGLQSGSVDGRLTFNDYLGGAYVGETAPWLLEQSTDVVGRLDPLRPWELDSTWSVAMNDKTDAGYAQPYSDPSAVIVATGIVAGSKAYVLPVQPQPRRDHQPVARRRRRQRDRAPSI